MLAEVELNTVDAFQGREQDIVIFSSVRTSHSGHIGFLSDARRLNVAMTRGKYGCYVVGRRQTLEQDSSWGGLLARAAQQGAIVRRRRRGLHSVPCVMCHVPCACALCPVAVPSALLCAHYSTYTSPLAAVGLRRVRVLRSVLLVAVALLRLIPLADLPRLRYLQLSCDPGDRAEKIRARAEMAQRRQGGQGAAAARGGGASGQQQGGGLQQGLERLLGSRGRK
eukprot:COSAG05_NODE_3058_length_2374_cov_1.291868_3_plen_224_part_00